jgi:hypothetical protein
MQRTSRRQFLKISFLVTGALYIPFKVNCYNGPVQCTACKAISSHYHRHREGKRSGLYCPNCGVETNSLRVELDNYLAKSFCNKNTESGVVKKIIWDCVQLPFPNPNLVKKTTKPAVLLSEINF